ncbi:hypothetical protein [Nostoc sp. 'Peltigera malacea cyanobiont' DB3992]|uniref:hypothetical protein n=1 Tax=Nostoc sp. 'Peltigera malacea cyanobiont' DB3992 TaxID=1206980 RepID=UPI0011800D74|nr:hypothetical protein [Nostoc sp. 'Peltigera malacea cyanobiont' DB3992]
MQYSRHLTSPLTAVKVSPLRTYGVHTSREIPPDTWFRPLAIGLCDGVPARRRRSLWKLVIARRNDVRGACRRQAIAKTYGIM